MRWEKAAIVSVNSASFAIFPRSAALKGPRILIAASGSGGHLFPARFIGEKIRELCPAAEIAFIGSGRPLEEKLIDSAGFKRYVMPFEILRGRKPGDVLRAMLGLPGLFAKVFKLFSEFQPSVVVGVGGYVSVLPVVVARIKGVPSWIHEAEIHAGRANRFLAFFASRISLAFENAIIPCKGKAVYTGHPVRGEFSSFLHNGSSASPSSVAPSHLLILGGSQGSQGLDNAAGTIAHFVREHEIEVRHQCRPENTEMVKRAYEAAGARAEVVSFIENMIEAFSWADVIISRSGAASVMELGIVGKPALLVPFPFSQGGHQRANAMVLTDRGKALLCEEGEDFHARLKSSLERIFQAEVYREMFEKPAETSSLDASRKIAEGILSLRSSAHSDNN